jgi:tRNA threonylcarbamoyladenosine biosynthesis protein TsaB
MAIILSLETATSVCSVALSKGEAVLALRESPGSNEHSALLTVFIEEIMQLASVSLKEIDAIAVSMGPGSYTGLRIGVSTAKGLCYAIDKPMIAVSTLKALSKKAIMDLPKEIEKATLLCPMIDARRMEVYMALYDPALMEIKSPDALVLDENTFADFSGQQIALFGTGADKCMEMYANNRNVFFPGSIQASASAIAGLAFDKFLASDFVDVAYFEPYYLKDFVAGKPKVKGLH